MQSRSYERLETDIARAEQYVISYTNNHFEDNAIYSEIPAPVKTAVILIAEMYANSAKSDKSEYKSESFDEYSYTLADITSKLNNLDLRPLLDEFIISEEKNKIVMKLRRL